MDFSKEDVVDIAMLAAEDEIQNKLKAANEASAEAVKDLEAAKGKMADALEAAVKAFDTQAIITTLGGALELIWGGAPKADRPKAQANAVLRSEDLFFSDTLPKVIEYDVAITITDPRESKSRYGRSDISLPTLLGRMSVPATVKQLHKEIQAADKKWEAARDEVNIWVTAKADLPTYRRKVRAALAKNQLRKTQGGQQILTLLLQGIESKTREKNAK